MQTQRIPVAQGVELVADTWVPDGDGVRDGVHDGVHDGVRDGVPDGVPDGPGVRDGVREAAAFVLVHGLASNARLWDGVAARLADRGRVVVTVDLRGHGRSSKPDGPYDVPTVADDVAALIAGLGLDRPVVAGQSWGGNVVLELAARHPGAVRGIACVDGGWLEPSAAFENWAACRSALAPPRLAGMHRDDVERRVRAAHPTWPETGIAGTLANFEVRADGTVAPWLTFERHIAVLRGLWDHRPSERYAAVAVPVLLVPVGDGDADREAHKRAAIDVALATLPDARARWFTGDHDIHAQHPDELADVMIDLLPVGRRP